MFNNQNKKETEVVYVDNPSSVSSPNKTVSYISSNDNKKVHYDESEKNDNNGFGLTMPTLVSDVLVNKNIFMNRVFDLMTIALLITAATSYFILHTELIHVLMKHTGLVLILLIGEIILANVLAGCAMNMAPTTAWLLFVVYSVSNGITLSPFFARYSEQSLVAAFVSAAAVFASMSCVGYATKKDLTQMGSFMLMALFGIIITMIINMFIGSSRLDTAISVVTVLVFTCLTAFDCQKIKRIGMELGNKAEDHSMTGIAIVAALILYLDFINLLIHLLKLFGKLKDEPHNIEWKDLVPE